jgi:hypothetical protein
MAHSRGERSGFVVSSAPGTDDPSDQLRASAMARVNLDEAARRLGAPLDEVRQLHRMEGILRRLAASAGADQLMLRGSLLTRYYCAPAPRRAQDLDFLALFPFDPGRIRGLVAAVVEASAADGCRYALRATSQMWEDSPFPGVRFELEATALDEPAPLQIDVSFHDPVVPPPRWLDYPAVLPGLGARVLVCSRETAIAWKTHGLYERGLGTFRPKDLADIALLGRGASIDRPALEAALQSAFDSHGTPLSYTDRLAGGCFGRSRWSQHKWARFVAGGAAPGAPTDIAEVVAEVAVLLAPSLVALGVEPTET